MTSPSLDSSDASSADVECSATADNMDDYPFAIVADEAVAKENGVDSGIVLSRSSMRQGSVKGEVSEEKT